MTLRAVIAVGTLGAFLFHYHAMARLDAHDAPAARQLSSVVAADPHPAH